MSSSVTKAIENLKKHGDYVDAYGTRFVIPVKNTRYEVSWKRVFVLFLFVVAMLYLYVKVVKMYS